VRYWAQSTWLIFPYEVPSLSQRSPDLPRKAEWLQVLVSFLLHHNQLVQYHSFPKYLVRSQTLHGSERSNSQSCTASKINEHSRSAKSRYTSIVAIIITRTRAIIALLVSIAIEDPQASDLHSKSSVNGFNSTGNSKRTSYRYSAQDCTPEAIQYAIQQRLRCSGDTIIASVR
jgi:hypothetical protein